MNKLLSLTLLTATSALTHDKSPLQEPLLKDASDLPWTYWPECYSNENTTEPICVFSQQDFASGRGIFIVTSTSNAYKILSKPAFTNPSVLSRVNNHANPPFEQHEFPNGKGRGLIANKTLHRGDQIFASTPLLISHPDAYLLSEKERLALAHRGVATLPPASQSLFWGLLDHFKGDPVDDRINTNAFDISIADEQQHVVLPEIAMLNHDCRPNAAYFWDEATLSHYVHATQTIYPGQEITITYINNERARAARVDNLEYNWGFKCSCSSCSAHPALVAESDARIAQMGELAEALDDWSSESSATPEMAEALISLFEQERLFAGLGTPYKHAAEVYASFGDRWNAVRYARLSAEVNLLDKGFSDVDVLEMRRMARDPELSWSWKKRVGHERPAVGCGHGHGH
ncbi:SET domain-containing protein [Lophiostoma macrostomum CBS 122681]|uniref:SET domain-containing protein n=1 Tax=Lophiostoma macrostomum CBS 122681 TaxID=1314788 RepID=A0A6A6T7D2_9PLEO|nr:SET domain-containing protein [Lophiostoma macrostomum CBS 122681]